MSIQPFYSHAGITIYHGDCREILPGLPACDLLLTDPPYGINYKSDYIGDTTTAQWMNQVIAGDKDTSLRDWVLTDYTEWACFGSYKVQPPANTKSWLVWDKGPASGMGDLTWPWKLSWELVFLRGAFWRGTRDEGIIKGRWIVTRASMGRVHPNEKPVELIQYLISKHDSYSVLDPFCGSGTTLVAAKNLNRRAIGIEIEERYCEIAAKRLSQEVLNFS